MRKKKVIILFATIAVLFVTLQSAEASLTTLEFSLDEKISGNPTPAGTPPWLMATFTDINGDVELTMAATNLASNESVQKWWFNYEGTDAAGSDLNFVYQGSSTGPNTIVGPNFDEDVKQAGGDGSFDIFMKFDNFEFTDGEEVVFLISPNTGTISPDDFNFGSVNSSQSYFTAARILTELNPGVNTAVVGDAVPIPGAAWLLGSGLFGLVFLRRRMRS